MSNTPNALTNGATRQHHWTDNEVENLRQAGVRVANGQSTWADEMVNMPAGLRLRNCRERFGRSFNHAGNPKAQTAACPPYIPANLPLYVSAPAPIVPAPVLPAPVVLAPVVPTNTPANLRTSLPAQAIPIFNNIFYGGLAELEKYVVSADRRLLEMVSTFKICEHKEDFDAVDLKFVVGMELLKLYETVAVVVEDLAECRVAAVEVGDLSV